MLSKVEEINTLHKTVFEAFKLGLDGAIRIGELLIQCKQEVVYGNWGKWITENLEFSQRTAETYMRLYAERDKARIESLSTLWEAEQALINHKPVIAPKVVEPEEPEAPEPLPPVEPKVSQIFDESKAKEPEVEPEEPDVVETEMDELVEDIKDIYSRLDIAHKEQVIDWILKEYKEAA
jgi:hypothetical protein